LIGVFREGEYIHGKSVMQLVFNAKAWTLPSSTKMPGQIKMAMQNM